MNALKRHIVQLLGLKLHQTTKHNEIWASEDNVLIYNIVTGRITIKNDRIKY